MEQNLHALLNDPQVHSFINHAMETGKSVSCESNRIKLNIMPNNNSITIKVEYKPNVEADEFKDYLQNLPDGVFVDICEMLGNEKVKQLSQCLESDNIETVRSGILAFKNALRQYATKQCEYYKRLISEL